MPWICPTCSHVFDVGPSIPVRPVEAQAEAGQRLDCLPVRRAAAQRELSRAVKDADPDAIAGASTRLVASSELGVSALRYGLKLALYLDQNAKKLKSLQPRARVEEIRRAWSELKRREGIRSSPELDSVVVTSASQTMRG